MRIGYDTLIENPLSPSSAIYYLQNLLEELSARAPEHEFFVFVSRRNKDLFKVKSKNVRFVNCFFSNENIPLRILVQQLYYPILSLRFKLDVIFGLNQVPLIAPCATVVKTCSLHHHLAVDEFTVPTKGAGRLNRLRLWYRRFMFDSSARRATLVIANSEYTKKCIADFVQLQESKIHVVYEAVSERFGTAQNASKSVQTRFGLERPYVLYVSNLWWYKNPDGAMRAFSKLRQAYKDDLDLVVVGPDDYCRLPELKRLAAQLEIADRVHFLGKCAFDDLIHLYAAARVLFYPSFEETFGKPIVEGMRSRIPVVAARSSSLPEILGSAGLLVDPRNVEEMADSLHVAVTDESLRSNLISLGEQRSQLFSWAENAHGTLKACLEATRARNTAAI
jgi:glycosyltransferase involved in cell wall biosynthesis